MPRNQSERVKPFGPHKDEHGFHIEILLEELVGHTLTQIEGCEVGSAEVVLHFKDATFSLHHSQDCCEQVDLDDINGDINDLIGSPLMIAEVICEQNDKLAEATKDYVDSHTWTFYKFATVKGYVTLRWYGQSNGYYSEEVSFARIK